MSHSRYTIRKNILKEQYIRNANGDVIMVNQPDAQNAIAYCHNPKHLGYLDESIMKQHKCLEKQCTYFNKYEEKSYWIKRSIKQALKKLHKNDGIGYIVINDRKFLTDSFDKLYKVCKSEKDKTGKVPVIKYAKSKDINSVCHRCDI